MFIIIFLLLSSISVHADNLWGISRHNQGLNEMSNDLEHRYAQDALERNMQREMDNRIDESNRQRDFENRMDAITDSFHLEN